MQQTHIQPFKSRISEIIDLSYKILCNKIAAGDIEVYNEASLQLQLSVILKNIGQLYTYAPNDRFSIVLEKQIKLTNATAKSPNRTARCDIWISLTNGDQTANAAIELKFFKNTPNETITSNRFALLCDLENLEQYFRSCAIDNNNSLTGYVIVYTNNANYSNPQSPSDIHIGQGHTSEGTINSNKRTVTLTNRYTFHWNQYPYLQQADTTNNPSSMIYFLKLTVPPTTPTATAADSTTSTPI